MKKVLFVINTMGRAGAEVSLINLLKMLPEAYEVSLLVLTGQGEMISFVPPQVKILNREYYKESVFSKKGRRQLTKTVLASLFVKGGLIKDFSYLVSNFFHMVLKGKIRKDKLLWRVLSDTCGQVLEEYDLAVSFIEGGSAYFVADHVNAKKKVAFLHIYYESAGYTRELDKDCYSKFDRIFCVSDEVKEGFNKVYPEHREKTLVFQNIIDIDSIKKMAVMSPKLPKRDALQFEQPVADYLGDSYKGVRLLTIGRLTDSKNWKKTIEAAGILKRKGVYFRWLLIGDGPDKDKLMEKVFEEKLQSCFALTGGIENPYAYLNLTDIYVHCSEYEGQSIAVVEAKILGKCIVVSDVPGNRREIDEGITGRVTLFDSEKIANCLLELINKPEEIKRYQLASLASVAKFAENNKKLVNELIECI